MLCDVPKSTAVGGESQMRSRPSQGNRSPLAATAAVPQDDTVRVSPGDTKNQRNTNEAESAQFGIACDADKDLATLCARLARSGYTLHLLDDGAGGFAYLVGCWNMSRSLPDRSSLRQFTSKVEVIR